MKKTIIYSAILALLLQSCASSQKFTVNATPGTRIYGPCGDSRGTVPESGKLEVNVNPDEYCGFFFSQNPGSELMVPFGLDVKKGNKWPQAWQNTGIVALCLSAPFWIIGGALCQEDGAVGGALLGTAAALSVGGAAVTPLSYEVGKNVVYANQFKYVPQQYAIQDVNVVDKLINPQPPREVSVVSKSARAKATSSPTSSSKQTDAKKSASSSSSRKLADAAKTVAGTYKCKGSLKSGSVIEERYNEAEVKISRIDKDHVSVTVMESGEEFFDAPMECSVKKQKDGSYLITTPDIPKFVLKVYPAMKNIDYKHESVNIEGDIYTLLLSTK